MQCKIQDAKTGILLKDKFRWVDCKFIDGQVGKFNGEFNIAGHKIYTDTNVLVEYMRAYYIKDEVVEKLNQERFYYRHQIRE